MRFLSESEINIVSGGGAGVSTSNGYTYIYVTGESYYKIGLGGTNFSSLAGSFHVSNIYFLSDSVTDPAGNVIYSQNSGSFCHNGVLIEVYPVTNGQAYVFLKNC